MTLDLSELTGQRVGTYLMSEIIHWAQQWPDATVNSINLRAGQAYPENKERRNRFYEQFGLTFDYTDPEHREGISRPILVKELTTEKAVKAYQQNITEHNVLDYLRSMLQKVEHATSELHFRSMACQDLINNQKKAMAHPIRWALRQLFNQYSSSLLVASLVSVLFCIAWLKILN